MNGTTPRKKTYSTRANPWPSVEWNNVLFYDYGKCFVSIWTYPMDSMQDHCALSHPGRAHRMSAVQSPFRNDNGRHYHRHHGRCNCPDSLTPSGSLSFHRYRHIFGWRTFCCHHKSIRPVWGQDRCFAVRDRPQPFDTVWYYSHVI